MNYAPHNRIYDNQIDMNYEYQIDFACKFESNEYKNRINNSFGWNIKFL